MLAASITVWLHQSLHRKVFIFWYDPPFNQGLDQSHFFLDMIIESITLFNHDKTKVLYKSYLCLCCSGFVAYEMDSLNTGNF